MSTAWPTWKLTGPLSPGVTLLEASAGTGKTFTIAALVLRLVAEQAIPIDRILVVTFTRAATAELTDRVRRRLVEGFDALAPDAPPSEDGVLAHLQAAAEQHGGRAVFRRRVRDAIERYDQANIATIHGFCQRMLQQHAFESRAALDVALVTDDGDLVADVADDLFAAAVHDASPAELEALTGDAKLDREGMRRLVEAALKDPDQPLSPDPETPRPDPAAQAAAALASFDAWAGQLDEAFAAAKGTVLNKSQRTYNARNAAVHVPPLRAWLEGLVAGEAVALPEKAAQWFASSTLADKSVDGSAPFTHPFFEALQAVEAAQSAVAAHRRAAFAAEARERFEAAKDRARVQTFQDLLRSLASQLGPEAEPASRSRLRRVLAEAFDAALIDEFQDTDDHQWTIFREVFGHGGHHLYLIGDPKQAIYGFRGANVHVYASAAHSASRRYTMDVNWRTDASLLSAVESLIGRGDGAFGTAGFDFVPVHAPGDPPAPEGIRFSNAAIDTPFRDPLALRWLPGDPEARKPMSKEVLTAAVASSVAADVVELLSSAAEIRGKDGWMALEPRHVAVLVRKGAQAAAVQTALSEVGVPAVLTGAESVLASEEARTVQWWLDALAEPGGRASRAAASTPVFGWTATRLAALEDEAPEAVADWDGWMASLAAWRELLRRDGLHRALRQALHDTGAFARLLGRSDGSRRLTNLMHVAELVHAAGAQERLGLDGLRRWLAARRASDDLDREERELRLERDDDAVQIMTIHRSKGLEFPICFAPFLWDVRLQDSYPEVLVVPSEDDPQRRVLDVRPDTRDPVKQARLERAQREEREESLRLMYVALTRAKHRVIVHGGRGNGVEASALGWALGREGLVPPSDPEAVAAAGEALDGVSGIRWAPVDGISGRVWRRPGHDVATGPLGLAPFRRSALEPTWRRHSYSALARFAGHEAIEDALRGVDRDDPTQVDPHLAVGLEDGSEPETTPLVEVPLARFPGGTEAGVALHGMLEHLDFQQTLAEPDHVREVVGSWMVRGGFDPEQWTEPVAHGLAAAIGTPLGGPLGTLRLGDIPRGARLDELRFDLPLAGGLAHGRHPSGRDVSVDAIVAALRLRAGDPSVPQVWLDALDSLRGRALSGFLTGAIDLVFRAPSGPSAGRWWVVDHKSNKVAPRADGALFPDAFGPERLRTEMALHHYYLQYHLYLVALHRYLRWRVPDYDYDEHIGGAAYLFVRGMIGPDTPRDGEQTHGVFVDRPPREVIEAIDEAFGSYGGVASGPAGEGVA